VFGSTPSTATEGGSVWFEFDPLSPGTEIFINKTLVYKGDATGVAFDGIVHLAEYPTPEPASVSFLALGGLVVLRRRRAPRG
jgi:hypothetical protein